MHMREINDLATIFADVKSRTITDILTSGDYDDVGWSPGPENYCPRVIKSIFPTIQSFCSVLKGKTVFDIGCHVGYYTLLLAEAGAEVVGVDTEKDRIMVAEQLRSARNLASAKFIVTRAEDYLQSNQTVFDITLCLNVFHHMLFDDPDKAWKFLETLSRRTKTLFLMLKTKTGELAYRLWGQNEQVFLQLLSTASSFTHYRKVIESSVYKGRDLWVLY